MEKFAIPDGFHLRGIVYRVISDLGKPVAYMCESSLKTKDVQVAGSGLNTIPVFVTMPEALCTAFHQGFLTSFADTPAAFRGDVKPILKREIFEYPDKINV